LIVRAPDSQISQSQPSTSNHVGSSLAQPASQPLPSGSTAFPKPAAKKFKADSQTHPRPRAKSKAATRDRVAYSTAYDDSEVEKDVRAMEDEADHLRRNSRAHTTIDSSLLAREPGVHFLAPSNTSRSKGKERIIDTSVEVPESETPQIERNKQLRQEAMDAYNNSLRTNGKNQIHRRKSSVGRGKRTSTSFATTGIISEFIDASDIPNKALNIPLKAQPHNSVSESSFYKDIDCDLPEPELIRQLLIWCSPRASSTSSSSSASSSKVPLPPLSADGVQVLQSVQKAVIRMLAEKKIDLSLYSLEADTRKRPPEDLRENEQNVRNRLWEVAYSQHIQQYVIALDLSPDTL
jgi:kinetochore protein Mis13/DSN1